MAVERMLSSDDIGDLAKELGAGRRFRYKWQAKLDYTPHCGKKHHGRTHMNRLIGNNSTG